MHFSILRIFTLFLSHCLNSLRSIQIANLCFFPGNPAKPDESFGGDFYKDFYYSQGDYSQEEAQETKEMKKKKTKA